MNVVVLKSTSEDGTPLEASFSPDCGMNLLSYKRGSIEVIDQSTKNLFEERYAGLGALIGPHFHHRRAQSIPKIDDESLFPHIARIRAKNVQEPFSHGIARYAPWKYETTEHTIKGVLTGKDMWNGVPLANLEGQNFKMTFDADLQPNGLHIGLSIVSDTDSLVGLHYYYALPDGKGTVSDAQNTIIHDLTTSVDQNFKPFPNPLKGQITLNTSLYNLVKSYACQCQENSWQLYHPAGASFVCIEPISAQDPKHPNLTVSSIQVQLQILPAK